MARRHNSYRVFEVRPPDPREERERVFIGRISKIIEALGMTVNDIDGVTSLPPALGKLVVCAAEANDSLRKYEEQYHRSKR